MDPVQIPQLFLRFALPQRLTLEDGTEVRISVVETEVDSSRLTLKLEFDLCIVFISVRTVAVPTYGLLVPYIHRAVASLRLAATALLDQGFPLPTVD